MPLLRWTCGLVDSISTTASSPPATLPGDAVWDIKKPNHLVGHRAPLSLANAEAPSGSSRSAGQLVALRWMLLVLRLLRRLEVGEEAEHEENEEAEGAYEGNAYDEDEYEDDEYEEDGSEGDEYDWDNEASKHFVRDHGQTYESDVMFARQHRPESIRCAVAVAVHTQQMGTAADGGVSQHSIYSDCCDDCVPAQMGSEARWSFDFRGFGKLQTLWTRSRPWRASPKDSPRDVAWLLMPEHPPWWRCAQLPRL